MSTHTALPSTAMANSPGVGPATRPNMVQVGTIVWLSSELMFFAGLFAVYFQIRSVRGELWAERTPALNLSFATINCLVLVISSVWCQIGVMKAERLKPARTGKLFDIGSWGMREWYVVTYLFGAFFIAGQVFEYAELTHEGITLQSDPYGSVFYMATGFHGLHVTGGLIAFLFVIARTFTTRRYTHANATTAVVTSYYWHFVDVVWIALFAVLYLLR